MIEKRLNIILGLCLNFAFSMVKVMKFSYYFDKYKLFYFLPFETLIYVYIYISQII